MSVSPRMDALLARAVDEHLTEQRSWREALEYVEERLESLEESVGKLESRLAKWSDPSEVADEVIGLEEEISVALGRFHKRLETATETIEAAVGAAVGAAVAGAIDPMMKELAALLEDLQLLPEVLEEHRAQIVQDVKGWRTRRQKD
jgi:predicted  nucleic acid-binding Zn-ribbon protein